MKKIFLCLALFLTACSANKTITQNNYSLEKYAGSEIPVCVNRPVVLIEKIAPCSGNSISACARDMCGKIIDNGVYEPSNDVCDILEPEVVSYAYCLQHTPKPPHLVIKTEKDMISCYDRNNKILLPVQFCLPDTNVGVSVRNFTSLNLN